jgi:hypothetical protein
MIFLALIIAQLSNRQYELTMPPFANIENVDRIIFIERVTVNPLWICQLLTNAKLLVFTKGIKLLKFKCWCFCICLRPQGTSQEIVKVI